MQARYGRRTRGLTHDRACTPAQLTALHKQQKGAQPEAPAPQIDNLFEVVAVAASVAASASAHSDGQAAPSRSAAERRRLMESFVQRQRAQQLGDDGHGQTELDDDMPTAAGDNDGAQSAHEP